MTVYNDGSRGFNIEKDEKVNPPSLFVIEELLEWNLRNARHAIMNSTIAAAISEIVDPKIIKPGFRPSYFKGKGK